jgi:hypothetical protein
MHPIGPAPNDEHVLAEHRKRQGGMHRISERVEDRRDLLVDPQPVMPDVRHRQRYVLRECAWALHAEPDRMCAEMAPARHAVSTAPADDMPLTADEVADLKVAHVRADRGHLTDELMSDDHRHRDRLLGPGIPAEDVQIGAADPRLADADQQIVDPNFGFWDVLEPKARSGFGLDQRAHARVTLQTRG